MWIQSSQLVLVALVSGGLVYWMVNDAPSSEKQQTTQKPAKIDPQRLADLEAEVRLFNRQLDQMSGQIDRRLNGLERRIKSIKRAGGRPGEGGTSARDPMPSTDRQSPTLSDELVKRVEQTVDEKIEQLKQKKSQLNWAGQWKAPMDKLAEKLELSDEEANAANDVFNAGKEEALALLKRQRADGGSLIDDLVDDIRAGEKQPVKKLFKRIFTEKVPGEDTTYMAAFGALSDKVKAELGEQLSPSHLETLNSLNVAVLEVNTGHDPTREYVRAQLEE